MARPFRRRVDLGGQRTWRNIAVNLCHFLHTPLSEIVRLRQEEALYWYAECVEVSNPKGQDLDG